MIKIWRAVLVILLFALFGFGALYITFCIFPFQKNKEQGYKTLKNSWEFFVKLMIKLRILKLEISDIEIIKNIKNSIIVSTHPSFIDIVILMSIIPDSTCFVAEKLGRNPFLKGIAKHLFILEGQPLDVWMNEALEKINNGLSIIIFPMGGRHRRNEFPKIRRGCALIAQKSGRDIHAISINTDVDFLQNGQAIYEAGEKEVLYNIDYLGKINTQEYLDKIKDDVAFKTEITKQISSILYGK